MTTIENVTVAKRVYKMLFDTVSKNFNQLVQDLSYDKVKNISEDFFLKNYSYSESITDLNDWTFYYYSFGKFPGSNEFINVPYHKKPYFLKTDEHLSPANLYKKFYASDILGIASFHALCALNIYLGGDKNYSAVAFGEFLKNMTYQALSQENDSIFLSFDEGINVAHSIVNKLADIANDENVSSIELADKLSKKLDFTFDAKKEVDTIFSGKEISDPEIKTSTPLSDREIKALYDKEKTDYLKSSLQINSVDLESAAERADLQNQKMFQEITDPTLGLLVDNKLNIDEQLNLESTHDSIFSNSLKASLDEAMEKAKDKIQNVSFTSLADDNISTEDIYFDDSFKEMLKTIKFKPSSTDDREDFELDVTSNEMILFKSPSLTSVNIYKKDLDDILKKIVNDLDSNLNDLQMSLTDEQNTKQKKVIVNQLRKRLEATSTKNIQNQLEEHQWLQNLIEDQLKMDNSFSFGQNYKNETNRFKNITKRKKRRSADYLEYLQAPSIYTLISPKKEAKVESGKKIFINIIKNIPLETYKTFKIQYDTSNDITVDEI